MNKNVGEGVDNLLPFAYILNVSNKEVNMEKTFVVAGISTHKNRTKMRASNSRNYHSVLKCMGHTNIHLLDLPRPLTKSECFSYISEHLKMEFEEPNLKAPKQALVVEKKVPAQIEAGSVLDLKVKSVLRMYPAMSLDRAIKQAQLFL